MNILTKKFIFIVSLLVAFPHSAIKAETYGMSYEDKKTIALAAGISALIVGSAAYLLSSYDQDGDQTLKPSRLKCVFSAALMAVTAAYIGGITYACLPDTQKQTLEMPTIITPEIATITANFSPEFIEKLTDKIATKMYAMHATHPQLPKPAFWGTKIETHSMTT